MFSARFKRVIFWSWWYRTPVFSENSWHDFRLLLKEPQNRGSYNLTVTLQCFIRCCRRNRFLCASNWVFFKSSHQIECFQDGSATWINWFKMRLLQNNFCVKILQNMRRMRRNGVKLEQQALWRFLPPIQEISVCVCVTSQSSKDQCK